MVEPVEALRPLASLDGKVSAEAVENEDVRDGAA